MYPSDAERLRQDLRHVVEDVEHILETSANATGEQAEAFRSLATERLHRVHARLGEMERDAAGRLQVAADRTNDYVKRRPWAVIGGAATAAFLLGVLSRSRH